MAVGRGVEVVVERPDGQRGAELLVPAVVLRRTEFRLPQRPFQRWEEVRNRLGIVPNVRAGSAQQPPSSWQPSNPHSRPSAWRRTVGDLRMVRLAATASMTSGGRVVS